MKLNEDTKMIIGLISVMAFSSTAYCMGSYYNHKVYEEMTKKYNEVGIKYHDNNNNGILDKVEKEEFNNVLYENKDVHVRELKNMFGTYELPHKNEWMLGWDVGFIGIYDLERWLNEYQQTK